MISGRASKGAIGATTLSETPICIAGFLAYLLRNGMSTWSLVIFLGIGAIVGAVVGPHITARFKSEKRSKSEFRLSSNCTGDMDAGQDMADIGILIKGTRLKLPFSPAHLPRGGSTLLGAFPGSSRIFLTVVGGSRCERLLCHIVPEARSGCHDRGLLVV